MSLLYGPGDSYRAHEEEISEAVRGVLDKGLYILGPEVEQFEKEFAAYVGQGPVVGVGSGTEAIHLALRACDIGRGDFVATVSHTAVATVAAVELAGATPVFVDIDPVTFTMHPGHLETTLSSHEEGRVKAVIPVHLYGHPADMPSLMKTARRFDLVVIEDCAQAHGASLDGARVGTFGHLAAFSFYPTKNLGAFGDGGALITGKDYSKKALLLRQYGWGQRFISDTPGMNTRLDEVQAAALRVKLKYLDRDNARRREIAALYDEILAPTSLVRPTSSPGAQHVFHQYVIRTPKRDSLKQFLAANSVPTAIHYPVPVHLQPAYQGRLVAELPHTEVVAGEILSLPIHPQMPDEDVRKVGELILRWDGGY